MLHKAIAKLCAHLCVLVLIQICDGYVSPFPGVGQCYRTADAAVCSCYQCFLQAIQIHASKPSIHNPRQVNFADSALDFSLHTVTCIHTPACAASLRGARECHGSIRQSAGPQKTPGASGSYLSGKAPIALICVVSKVWVWCHLVLLHEQCMMLILGAQYLDACLVIFSPH